MASLGDQIARWAAVSNRPLRTLLLVAHPDDETVSAAAMLCELGESRLPFAIAHTTDGAPADLRDARACGFPTREAYARARRLEFARAMEVLPAVADQCFELGFADQRLSYELTDVVLTVESLCSAWHPDVLLTHPYEGGHPDHDATAFAAHLAARRLRHDGAGAPAIVEFTSYHLSGGKVRTGAFLDASGDGGGEPVEVAIQGALARTKARMVSCFESQAATLSRLQIDREKYRRAPHYDFRRPPHAGPLWYDFFSWGITSDRWSALAADALDALSPEGSACR